MTLPYPSCRALVYQGCITLVNVHTTTIKQHRVVFKRKLPTRAIFLHTIFVVRHTPITSVSKTTLVVSQHTFYCSWLGLECFSPGLSSSPFQGVAWRYSNSGMVESAVWSCTLCIKPTMLKPKVFQKRLLSAGCLLWTRWAALRPRIALWHIWPVTEPTPSSTRATTSTQWQKILFKKYQLRI